MKKLFTNLKVAMALLLLCGVCSAWADSATLKWSDKGLANSTAIGGNSYNVGTYFSVTCSQNSASTPPTYYTTGTAVRLYATKNTNTGNIITVSTNSSGVYITKVIYNGTHSKQGTTKFSYSGTPTQSDETSATYSESDKLQNVTATLCETGGSKNGQFYFTDIEIQYVVRSTNPTYNVVISDQIQNGSVSATPSLAEKDAEITLVATPNNGYIFEAWDVKDADNNEILVSNNKFSMPGKDVTVSATFAELPKHTVTLVQPEGASLTINGGTTALQLYEGQQVDISVESVSPGYTWGKWTVEGTGAKVTTTTAKNTKFTMGTSDATLSGLTNKLSEYSITWSILGSEETSIYYEGDKLSLPTEPNPATLGLAEGFVFMGWSADQVVASDGTGFTPVVAGGDITTDATYYAVFAYRTGDAGTEKTVTLENSTITGDFSWAYTGTNKTLEDDEGNAWTFSGTYHQNKGGLQLGQKSGIGKTPEFSDNIKSIKFNLSGGDR